MTHASTRGQVRLSLGAPSMVGGSSSTASRAMYYPTAIEEREQKERKEARQHLGRKVPLFSSFLFFLLLYGSLT